MSPPTELSLNVREGQSPETPRLLIKIGGHQQDATVLLTRFIGISITCEIDGLSMLVVFPRGGMAVLGCEVMVVL